MTNDTTNQIVSVCRPEYVQPALICGGWMDGLVVWLVLFVAVFLFLSAIMIRKATIQHPEGIYNPQALLKATGVLLGVAAVVWLWLAFDAIQFALFVIGTDMSGTSKESFLLGIFQTPRFCLTALSIEALLWTGMVFLVRTLKRKMI